MVRFTDPAFACKQKRTLKGTNLLKKKKQRKSLIVDQSNTLIRVFCQRREIICIFTWSPRLSLPRKQGILRHVMSLSDSQGWKLGSNTFVIFFYSWVHQSERANFFNKLKAKQTNRDLRYDHFPALGMGCMSVLPRSGPLAWFPALGTASMFFHAFTGHKYLIRVRIGWLGYLRLLWLARLVTLLWDFFCNYRNALVTFFVEKKDDNYQFDTWLLDITSWFVCGGTGFLTNLLTGIGATGKLKS